MLKCHLTVIIWNTEEAYVHHKHLHAQMHNCLEDGILETVAEPFITPLGFVRAQEVPEHGCSSRNDLISQEVPIDHEVCFSTD